MGQPSTCFVQSESTAQRVKELTLLMKVLSRFIELYTAHIWFSNNKVKDMNFSVLGQCASTNVHDYIIK